jgi:hypothetical protein
MLKINIKFGGVEELKGFFKSLPEEFQKALRAKTQEFAQALKDKIVANVSGILLNRKSGDLAQSIHYRTRQNVNSITAWVGIEADSKEEFLKAYVHEYGGKGSTYPIHPKNSDNLSFFWERIGRNWIHSPPYPLKYNFVQKHPPAEAKHYIQSAYDEMKEEIYIGYGEVIDNILRR